jgi:hypothetical protein
MSGVMEKFALGQIFSEYFFTLANHSKDCSKLLLLIIIINITCRSGMLQ